MPLETAPPGCEPCGGEQWNYESCGEGCEHGNEPWEEGKGNYAGDIGWVGGGKGGKNGGKNKGGKEAGGEKGGKSGNLRVSVVSAVSGVIRSHRATGKLSSGMARLTQSSTIPRGKEKVERIKSRVTAIKGTREIREADTRAEEKEERIKEKGKEADLRGVKEKVIIRDIHKDTRAGCPWM